jgi:hypothetical protein
VWDKPVVGLLITAALTLIASNAFDLTSVSTLGSAGFLLIFAAVNTANVRHALQTNSLRWILATGCGACLVALAALCWQTGTTAPAKLWVLAAMIGFAVLIEGSFRLKRADLRV